MTLCNLLPFLIGLGSALIGYWIGKMIGGSRIAELEAELEQKDAAFNKLNGEHAALFKSRAALQIKTDAAEAAGKDWEEKYHILFGKHNDLTHQHDVALAGHNSLTAKYNGAVADLDALGNRHNAVVADFDDHKTKTDATVRGFEGLVGEWTAERADVERRLAETTAEIDRLKAEQANWDEKRQTIYDDYRLAKGQILNLEEALAATRKENAERIAALHNDYGAIKSANERADTDARSYTVHIDDLTREKNDDLQAFANYKADTEARLVRAQAEYADLEGRYNGLKEMMNRQQQLRDADHETLQLAHENLTGRHNQLLDDHRQIHEQLADLQDAHRLAGEKIQAMQNEHAAYANDMEIARTTHRADYDALMNHFNDLQSRYDALEAEHRAHANQAEENQKGWNQQISDWTKNYNDLQQKHQDLNLVYSTQADGFNEAQRAQNEALAKLQVQYAEAGRTNKELHVEISDLEAARQEADEARMAAEQKLAAQAADWEQKYDQLNTAHDQLQIELDRLNQDHTTALQEMDALHSKTAQEIEGRQTIIDEWSKRYSTVAINLAECERMRTEAADAGRRDDLKIVEGIGPKIEELLHNAGIFTFKQLSSTSTQLLREILSQGGARFVMHDPGTWPAQADLASNGEWDKLREYKDYLMGGKEPKKEE